MIKAIIAYDIFANRAAAKMEVGFYVGIFKSRPMFLRPKHLPCFLMLNGRKPAVQKWHERANPFLFATVAKKAETKPCVSGVIGCAFCKRYT